MKWPHRPKVELFLPREVRIGDTFDLEVRLHAKRDVNVGPVTVRVTGQSFYQKLVSLVATVFEGGELTAGEHRWRARVTLPEGLPPSYRGERLWIRYRVETHVDIPFWPDRDASFELTALPAERPLPDESPYHFSTRPEGPVGGKPHVEGIVDRRVLAVGDTIAGRVALSNLAAARYSRLEVALVAYETIGASAGGTPGQRFVLTLPLPLSDGEAVSFHMRVPTITPTFSGPYGALSWVLEVAAKHSRGTLRVPIPIELRAADPAATARRLVPALPSIGHARVLKLWSRVGAEHGYALQEGVLRWRQRRLAVDVGREHRGREGVVVVAEVTWPDLGLGLRGGPRGVLGRLIGQLALEGESAPGSYFKEHDSDARFPAQGRGALRLLFPDATGTVRVAEIRDDGARLELDGLSEDPGGLSHFLALARALAENAEDLRERMPAPDPLAEALPAWEAWARTLPEARLDRSLLTLVGLFEGARVRVGHVFEAGGPLRATLQVLADGPLDPCFVARDTVELAAQPKLDAEARALAGQILEAGDLEVREDAVEVRLGAPVDDPAKLEALLRRLVRFAAKVRRGAGPYR
ncbi:MAG: hypothetical protein H6721_20565 [Sandaracinus sp.]|nr:hypothetical protein [Sandaracinus sp.]